MKELCVAHLVRAQNGIEPFKRFLDSYQRNSAGVEHDFLIIFKGFNNQEELKIYQEALRLLKYIPYEISDEGFDLTAYFSVVKVFENQYRFFFFLNSFSEILDINWLEKLYQIALKPDVGLVGVSGSWQSHRLGTRLSLFSEVNVVCRNHFNLYEEKAIWKRLILSTCASYAYLRSQWQLSFFPNYHIRTNAFMISSSLMNSLNVPEIGEKMIAYMIESGKNGISQQIMARGKKLLLVGKNGISYEKKEWNRSNIFWQSNQGNLLVSDNQTRDYQYGALERRKLLSTYAWGSSINIADGIDLSNYPKVSVCIPVRNGGKFLHVAVNSVFMQTYTNYELIVIDNASSDDTAQWVEHLARTNSKIKFFKNEKNIGLIENFNACLQRATGEYIKFLCADDELMPNCLEQMVCALEANKSATLVTVDRLIISENNDVLASKNYSKVEVLVNGKDAINRCLFGTNYIGEPSATMFRRRVGVDGFDTNFPHLVDLELWFRILEKGDLVSIPQCLCAIRRHELQMTQQNIKSGLLVEDNVRLFDLYKDKPYIKHTFIANEERRMRMAYRVWMCRHFIESKRKKEILKSQSSFVFYYLLIPIISFVLNMSRIISYQFSSRFLSK